MKAVHCTRYDGQTYFAIGKDKNGRLHMHLHCTWFEICKTYPAGTKFHDIYTELKTALGVNGYNLNLKYNHDNFIKTLKNLSEHQLSLSL